MLLEIVVEMKSVWISIDKSEFSPQITADIGLDVKSR